MKTRKVAKRASPRHSTGRRILLNGGASKSSKPIIDRKHWKWLPPWIALHAERGTIPKCWEGHRMFKASYDSQNHGQCVWCETEPPGGSPILVCHKCSWTICSKCRSRPRLPPLEADPLFHGPSPCLLPASAPIPQSVDTQGTVIICPGGNYEFLVPHEGIPAADWLAKNGIRAFVLRYRLLPSHGFEDMMQDLTAAVQEVRKQYVGPVAAMGFSAGGHLVASLALRTKGPSTRTKQLDAQVLVYPCIDGKDWAHPEYCGFFDWDRSFPAARSLQMGRTALLGGKGFAAPPSFLVASTADEASPPKEHTDKYSQALKKNSIPYTYLRRDFGAHGFGLSGGWTDQCVAWLKQRGFGCTCDASLGGA